MYQYIKLCAGLIMITVQQHRMYGVENLFPWMTSISLQGTSTSSKNVPEVNTPKVALA
jgi:hypothetical protein